ncbi:YceI family protein [Bowmanella denitrificans]|uniref:YceI family protein n=1 Tax=Bowmanella denitrificans TaxID=366582 RepID=UPI000C9D061B|nr:YceI family protein [Bowmanella denitrificans]
MKRVSLAALLLCSQAALADWQMDQQVSSLSFLSTKNNLVTETHHFTDFNGTLAEDGSLAVKIELNSVETNIAIRNERMREHLFKLFPTANLTAQLPNEVMGLDVGESMPLEVKGQLELNSKTQILTMQLQVTRLANEQLLATTVQPVLVNSVQFGLTDGIKKLQELAGLASIDQTVPVTFNVVFNAAN